MKNVTVNMSCKFSKNVLQKYFYRMTCIALWTLVNSKTCIRRPLLGQQKWLSWAGDCLIKYLYKATTNQIWSFLSVF